MPPIPPSVLAAGFSVPTAGPYPCDAFVYFLTDRGEVVYVGSTIGRLGQRVRASVAAGRGFDRLFVLPAVSWEVREIEARYIRLLRPRYNAVGMAPKWRPRY